MRTDVLLDRAGTVIASATQDVEPILQRNAQLRSERQRGDWGRQVATIPNVILLKWLNEEHARGNTGLRMFTSEFDELVAQARRPAVEVPAHRSISAPHRTPD
jgi:hypothetical protein